MFGSATYVQLSAYQLPHSDLGKEFTVQARQEGKLQAEVTKEVEGQCLSMMVQVIYVVVFFCIEVLVVTSQSSKRKLLCQKHVQLQKTCSIFHFPHPQILTFQILRT